MLTVSYIFQFFVGLKDERASESSVLLPTLYLTFKENFAE